MPWHEFQCSAVASGDLRIECLTPGRTGREDGSLARLVTLFGRLEPNGRKRFERELHDQYGIDILGHPDLRPLVFHDNWPDNVHAMADDASKVPWVPREYRFLEVQGKGVTEVAVGPVHAGIIEPGHFRFSVVGDTVLHLELRHFYTHKGTERLFQGRPACDGAMLAESVSGDNCFAHGVAYSQAVENACSLSPPPRAAALRLIGQELERLLCHIGDLGGHGSGNS